jgi:two-component system response regulator (stage 0 sporulation protein F)
VKGMVGEKQRILVVDDEQDIALVLQMMLNDYYDVDAYTNPAEALSIVKPDKYDLVLFDYLMPEMNGYEFYRKLKQIDPEVKICMMSAYEAIPTDDKDSQTSPPFDSKFVLKKPFDLDKILSKLKEILNDKQ